ncbi:helix-turn-helix domain-containing protein [Alkalimarinus alittae]|uniref:Helix-turn-helix domain-containing protein n=1 Tax=Alkalimarinus alittae TaxID=2961619 RepID=A0ABY6MXW4_9ALTE|nr:helix-turn-helix domain-containing protein [Alkalimarinus alittae]UZE94645.1 helix-turn-helix domain-containing protein [Alkalimarinus alittae]
MNQILLPETENTDHIACLDCALHPVCAPKTIGESVIDISESLVLKKQPIKAGQIIYTEGQPFKDLYAFTAGSAKEVWHSSLPKPQITSFKLKGELAGQNGIAMGAYPNTLIALEDSSVCIMDYQSLIKSANSLPSLLTNLVNLFAIDSHQETEIRKSLAVTTNAETKVRAFLYNISSRYKLRSQNYIDIKLSMSRSEIANYLGITKETLSRSLTILQNKNLIEASGKNIHIVNYSELKI